MLVRMQSNVISTAATSAGQPLTVARLERSYVAYVTIPKKLPNGSALTSEPFFRRLVIWQTRSQRRPRARKRVEEYDRSSANVGAEQVTQLPAAGAAGDAAEPGEIQRPIATSEETYVCRNKVARIPDLEVFTRRCRRSTAMRSVGIIGSQRDRSGRSSTATIVHLRPLFGLGRRADATAIFDSPEFTAMRAIGSGLFIALLRRVNYMEQCEAPSIGQPNSRKTFLLRRRRP